MRDEENPAQAARLLVRPDNPPPRGVSEAEIPELIRSLLKVIKSGDTNPPFGFGPEELARERANALNGFLVKAAEDLGMFNPKGIDANVKDNKGVIPEPETLGEEPFNAVHGANTLLQKPSAGAVGNANKTVPYKFLTFCFFDEQDRLREVIEELGPEQSPVRQTLIELGIPAEVLDQAHEAHLVRRTSGSLPGNPDFRHKQIQFPLGDGKYHSLSPLPNTALHREIVERTRRRFYSREEDEEGASYWERFSMRDMAVGGTQPQNAGLLTNYLRAMPCLYAAPPNLALPSNMDFLRDLKRYGTLFPRWLGRHIRRTGAPDRLLRAASERENRLNIHTRRRMDRAAAEIAREAMAFAENVRWIPSEQVREALHVIPAEEGTLLRRYFPDVSRDEDSESPGDLEQAKREILDRLLDRIKNISHDMGKLATSEDVAQSLRAHLERQLESL